MSSKSQNLSSSLSDTIADLSGKKISLVVSEWNTEITHSLRDACVSCLKENKITSEYISIHYVPGTFELPSGAKMVNTYQKPDAIICIGCVITGETKHDEYISGATANAIMQLSIALDKPVIFGVLTPKTMEQAKDRAGGKYGNKGVEAATTALKMLALKEKISNQTKKIGF